MTTRIVMTTLVALVALLSSCGPPDAPSDCGGMCEPAGDLYPGVGECVAGACSPTYIPCVEKGEVETCAEACAAQGTSCAVNGCDGATYAIYAVIEWCQEPTGPGGLLSRSCDEPIEWQVNEAARCCCEQP